MATSTFVREEDGAWRQVEGDDDEWSRVREVVLTGSDLQGAVEAAASRLCPDALVSVVQVIGRDFIDALTDRIITEFDQQPGLEGQLLGVGRPPLPHTLQWRDSPAAASVVKVLSPRGIVTGFEACRGSLVATVGEALASGAECVPLGPLAVRVTHGTAAEHFASDTVAEALEGIAATKLLLRNLELKEACQTEEEEEEEEEVEEEVEESSAFLHANSDTPLSLLNTSEPEKQRLVTEVRTLIYNQKLLECERELEKLERQRPVLERYWETQRLLPVLGWRGTRHGAVATRNSVEKKAKQYAWRWLTTWEVERSVPGAAAQPGKDGWLYAKNWSSSFCTVQTPEHAVRRRRWLRQRRPD